MERIKNLSLYIFFGLLAYMPLHIFLSTWFGTAFHVLELAKVAKDIVLIAGLGLALVVSIKQPWFKGLFKDKLAWLIGFYAVITLLLAIVKPTDADAEMLGIVYNLRFLMFFIYGILLSQMYGPDWLQKNAVKAVLGVGLVVMVFGFVQYMWLPNDALAHVGYSRTNGVLPAFFIDEKPDLERIMSTLRDPNSLGSYLIIIWSISVTFFIKTKNQDLKKVYGGMLALCLMCLWFTFSRSAWLGTIIATSVLGVFFYTQNTRIRIRKQHVVAVAVLILLGAAGLFASKDTYFVKNVIFHADDSTTLEDPNQLRVRFVEESVDAAVENPLGYGPGTAGLASIRNDKQGVILNENYYLQILHEVGLIGLIMFLAALILVGKNLLQQSKKNALALALLASLVGLIFTNLLVHIWSNEAVSYTWWGLAGLTHLITHNSDNKKSKSK